MADEDKVQETTDQTPDPAAAADQTESPEGAETEEQATPKEEAAPQAEEEPLRFTQATFTKLTQELAEERRARKAYEAKLDEVLSTRRATEPPPEEEPPENPQVEKILRGSKTYRALAAKADTLERTLQSVSELAVTQGLASQFPEIAAEVPQFIQWVKEVPGRAGAMQSGALGSEKAIIAAYRAEHPAKSAKRAATQAVKPAPKVEGESRPGGVVRDIRQRLAARGVKNPSFDEILGAASNEVQKGAG